MRYSTILDVLRANSEKEDKLLFKSAGRRLSFSELERNSNRIAVALHAMGVGSNDRIAVLSKDQAACLHLLFGAMKTGAVCVPVNWRLSADEISYVLQDSCAKVVFVDQELLEKSRSAAAALNIKLLLIDGTDDEHEHYAGWYARHGEQWTGRSFQGSDPALHLYSSGTTGKPKGVVLTHRGLMSACRVTVDAWGLNEASVVGHALPTFHIAGVLLMLFPVFAGCTCVAFREFDPKGYLRALEDERISHVLVVPAIISFLLLQPEAGQGDYSHLRLMAYAGSPITDTVLRKAIEVFQCEFSQIYGLTEVTGVVTTLSPQDHRQGAELLRSAGKPLPGVELRIVDPVSLEDLGESGVGEVWIRSERNLQSYWRREDATREAFPEGVDEKGGWFRSGDAGHLRDGYLYLSDRIKDMIISGGENIYPIEVENAMMKHEGVADCAVFGVPDPLWGEAVKACVVLKQGASATADDLINFTRSLIAHYKCPKSVDFVSALPRTESGKLMKRVLRAPYWNGNERAIN